MRGKKYFGYIGLVQKQSSNRVFGLSVVAMRPLAAACALGLAALSPLAQADLNDGLVAYYSFDGNALDSSGNGNHGTVYGGLIYTTGMSGQAASFDGINDYVRVPLNNTLRFNPNRDSFSLTAWARPKSMRDVDGTVGCWMTWTPFLDTYTYFLSNQGTDAKRSYSNQGGPFLEFPLWDSVNWHLFVGTWGIESGQVAGRFYVDGELVEIGTFDITPGGSYSWTDLLIGATQHCTASLNFSQTDIDEARIYNRVLSDDEIKEIANMKATLSVTKSGTGQGQITSADALLNCGTMCKADYYALNRTAVTLTATPMANSQFQGWTGDCSGTTPTTTVTLDAAKTCTATFASVPRLTVSKTGQGSGTISSTPVGISCGKTCSYDFPANSKITLAAYNITGSTFTGWSGDCSGTASKIVVTLDQAKNCIANFDVKVPPPAGMYSLTVAKTGTGQGTITGSTSSINCGTNCLSNFKNGATYWLTAKSDITSKFVKWTGDCSGTNAAVKVTFTKNLTCTAEFTTK